MTEPNAGTTPPARSSAFLPDLPASSMAVMIGDIDVRTLLPVVVEQYREMARRDPGADARTCAAHHTACRAALAHVAALMRLATLPATEATREESLSDNRLLEDARAAVSEAHRESHCDACDG